MTEIDQRLSDIERRLAALESAAGSDTPKRSEPPPIRSGEGTSGGVTPPPLPKPEEGSGTLQWLAERWLPALGVLLLLFSVGWFLRYAFSSLWMTPSLRVGGAGVGSLLLSGLGCWLLQRQRIAGQLLTALGTLGLVLTAYTAYGYYGMLGSFPAFVAMVVVVGVAAAIALVYRAQGLAVLAGVGAVAIPYLVGVNRSPAFLTNYMLMIDVALVGMAIARHWGWLLVIGWLGTMMYSDALLRLSEPRVYLLIAAYYAVFFLGSVVGILSPSSRWRGQASLGIILSTLMAFLWLDKFVPANLHSIVYLAAAAWTLVPAFLLHTWTEEWTERRQLSGWVMGLSIIAFVTATVMHEFSGAVEVRMLFLEALAVVAVARYLFHEPAVMRGATLCFLLPVVMTFDLPWLRAHPFDPTFITLLVAAGTLGLAALMHVRDLGDAAEGSGAHFLLTVLTIGFAAYAAVIVWDAAHHYVTSRPGAIASALIIYTVAGVGLMFLGVSRGVNRWRRGGVFILVAVLARLLLVDVWVMPPITRMITFAVVGALLIATVFFERGRSTKG